MTGIDVPFHVFIRHGPSPLDPDGSCSEDGSKRQFFHP